MKVGQHIKLNGAMYDEFSDSGTLIAPPKRKGVKTPDKDSEGGPGTGGTGGVGGVGGTSGVTASGWGFAEGGSKGHGDRGIDRAIAFEDERERGERGERGGGGGNGSDALRPSTGEGPPPLTAPTPNTPLPPNSAQRGRRPDSGPDLFGVGSQGAGSRSAQGKMRKKLSHQQLQQQQQNQ